MLGICSCQEMPKILLRQRRWNVLSLRSRRVYRVQLSLRYSSVLSSTEVAGDVGPKIGEVESAVSYGDDRSGANVLAQDVSLFYTDREAKL